jgi:acyl carrier protein
MMHNNNKTASSKLRSAFSDVFGISPDHVHPELGPGDVERWDSMGHVMLIAAIETEFSIKFEVEEIMEFTSFQSILSAIELKLEEPPPKAL